MYLKKILCHTVGAPRVVSLVEQIAFVLVRCARVGLQKYMYVPTYTVIIIIEFGKRTRFPFSFFPSHNQVEIPPTLFRSPTPTLFTNPIPLARQTYTSRHVPFVSVYVTQNLTTRTHLHALTRLPTTMMMMTVYISVLYTHSKSTDSHGVRLDRRVGDARRMYINKYRYVDFYNKPP